MARGTLAAPRALKPSNYNVFEKILVQDFSGAPDFNPDSAYTVENTIVKNGDASARMAAGTSAATKLDFYFTGAQITESGIGLWLFKPEDATWTSFLIYLADSSGLVTNHYASATIQVTDGTRSTSGPDQRTGWNWFHIQTSDLTNSGTFDVKTATIDRVRIRNNSLNSGDMIIDSMFFNVRARAKMMFMADDSHDSFWGALGKDVLDAAGFPATIYQTRDLVDAANYATTAQLKSAYDDGWDICNHFDEHVQLTNIVTGISEASQAVVTVSTSHSNKINVGDEMELADVEGMTEINGTHLVVAVPSTTTVTLDVDSTGFSTYTANGKLRYTEAQLKTKLDPMQSWLKSNNMPRGLPHFGYPTGIFDIEFHPAFMQRYGFKTARSIHSTLINHHVDGLDNMFHLWAKGVGVSVSAQDVIDKIDQAIRTGDTFCVYIHGLTTGAPAEDTYFWLASKFQLVVDYAKIKQNNGEIDVVTISQWYDGL